MERGITRFGCDWTGVTISSEQLKWAKERAERLFLEDKVVDMLVVHACFTTMPVM